MNLHDKYGINKRTQLKEVADNHIAIVKKIKSRIIQKDAQKIIELASKLREDNPGTIVSLVSTKNICSKSIKLLEDNSVRVHFEDLD